MDLAVAPPRAPPVLAVEALEDLHLRAGDGLGVVVHLRLAHVGPALRVVVLLHEIGLALENVDRLLVEHRRRGVEIHLRDDAGVARDVLDHEVVRGDAAQADRIGGIALARPMPSPARPVDEPVFLEEAEHLLDVLAPEDLVGAEGQLERRALHVAHEDVQVVGVDPALLHGRVEEVVRMAGDELVQRGRVGNQYRDRGARAPAGAARLLPRRGHAPRIAEEDGGVEAADVDAELEGVGGDHPQHRAFAEAALDLAPLQRQVAAPVAPHDALGAGACLERLLEIRQEHLGGEPRGGEHDRLEPLVQEGERDVPRAVEGRAPDAQLPVHHRRVVDREIALAARRSAAVDDGHRLARERLGQLLRVADRGR